MPFTILLGNYLSSDNESQGRSACLCEQLRKRSDERSWIKGANISPCDMRQMLVTYFIIPKFENKEQKAVYCWWCVLYVSKRSLKFNPDFVEAQFSWKRISVQISITGTRASIPPVLVIRCVGNLDKEIFPGARSWARISLSSP